MTVYTDRPISPTHVTTEHTVLSHFLPTRLILSFSAMGPTIVLVLFCGCGGVSVVGRSRSTGLLGERGR
eukprot:5349197-Prymnesium_polylepis.1